MTICVEEAFVTAEIAAEWKSVLKSTQCEIGFRAMGDTILADTPANSALHAKLLDIGSARIAHMDRLGVDMHILSLTSPGVQVFGADLAARLARDANIELAKAVRRFPARFGGLGAIAPHAISSLGEEVEHIKGLGLHGVIINSHTFGEYLDLPKFEPLWEALEAVQLPLYLHPREPSSAMITPYLDYGLYFAGWGFAAETGLHAMRLIMSGLFDRHPRLKILLGHMGEGLPFWLQRIDNRYLLQVKIGAVKKLPRLPSEYFLDNFVITTAGVTSAPVLRLAIEVLGAERVLFATDYPYENDAEALDLFNRTVLSDDERHHISRGNAERIFCLRTTVGGKDAPG
jgi:5-carboxyvanillate decarboxylase